MPKVEKTLAQIYKEVYEQKLSAIPSGHQALVLASKHTDYQDRLVDDFVRDVIRTAESLMDEPPVADNKK